MPARHLIGLSLSETDPWEAIKQGPAGDSRIDFPAGPWTQSWIREDRLVAADGKTENQTTRRRRALLKQQLIGGLKLHETGGENLPEAGALGEMGAPI